MRYIEGGSYTTGMKLPLPYGVVDTTQMEVVEAPELECPEAIASTSLLTEGLFPRRRSSGVHCRE
jgi:hypothetical protein